MDSGEALDDRRDPLTEPDAEGAEPVPQALALELVEEGRQEPRAGRPEGMAQRDRAAVHVDRRGVEPEGLDRREGDGGERLVDLPQVDVVDREARFLEDEAGARPRSLRPHGGGGPRHRPADETRARGATPVLRLIPPRPLE